MSDLPPDSAGSFEIRPRLNEEMEYFKEMALQETEKWIELVTKKRFKYPDDPRRSLQDGTLLCELVNALKPGSVRKINRLPTPIAFLDNLTVFQNACRSEFAMQDSQLFDIKDLEDLSLRGVLESEEDIQAETSRRLKNVVITIFWLGKAVRRWYKGPMLDFAAFTDIIDMSHSSQASFRTPSEASYVSSSTGRGFPTDRYSSSKAGSKKQSDMAYERVAKYLESKPVYGYQTSYDNQEPVNRSPAPRGGEVFQRPGSDFEEEYFGGSVDSGDVAYRPVKFPSKQMVPLPATDQSRGSTAFQTRTNGTHDTNLKVQQSDSSHFVRNYREGGGAGQQRTSERVSSPESVTDEKGTRVRMSVGSPRADGVRSPVSPGTAASLNPLQFVKGDSSYLAENARQTMQRLQQQQQRQQQQQQQHQQQQQGVRQMTSAAQQDDNWEDKLSDWKSRRRSQTKSQTTSEADDDHNRVDIGVRSDDLTKHEENRQSSTVPHVSTEHSVEPTSPTRTVIKKREQEEDMLAVFGFTKIPDKPARKPKVAKKSSEEETTTTQRDSAEVNQWKSVNQNQDVNQWKAANQNQDVNQWKPANQNQEVNQWKSANQNQDVNQWKPANQNQETVESESERQRFDERISEKHLPMPESDAVSSTVVMPVCEGGFRESTAAEVASVSSDQKMRYLEKVIKISQRPKHHKGFGFSIKGGKEYGMPITVDKVHLGGAADVCDLMSKDEIVAINGAQLANHYLESVRSVIDQAVHCGQVELTIRRTLNSDKSFDESESDVFAEEDLVFDVDQNEDETDSKLAEMLELEKDRPVTPVPPEDEPPPLPAAPPPLPNWNTFPVSPQAFCPPDDIQYFDDAEPSEENLRQEEVSLSKALPVTVAPRKDEVHEGTGSERSPAAKVEAPGQRSEPEKFDMLMKRIHFFGLKPEDSEEYRKAMEEKNSKQVKSEVDDVSRSSSSSSSAPLKSPAIQTDERMFAVVVKPCDATQSSPHQTIESQTMSSSLSDVSSQQLQSVATLSSSAIPSPSLEVQGGIEQQDEQVEDRDVVGKVEEQEVVGKVEELEVVRKVEEQEVVRKVEVQTTSREVLEDVKGVEARSFSPGVDREKFFAEYGKSDLDQKHANRIFDSRERKTEVSIQTTTKSESRFESKDQLTSTSEETTHVYRTFQDAIAAPSSLSEGKSTPQEDRQQNGEAKLREKPKDAIAFDSQHRRSENFAPLETSKAWRSMEMLRSLSVSDAGMVDPTERAKEDYLSLMMAQPKLSLEKINRQYFDLDSDLKRMEEWHKKQEELRKEKFDRDQEEIRLKHENALKEATVLEKEKQKQEDQMLEKDIIWKRQLEEIQQQRDKELLAKRQREEREQQKLAAEKADRERKRERERQLEMERETELERQVNELFSFTECSQSQLRDSGHSPQSPRSDVMEKADDTIIGKVEIQFIDSAAPTHANLEVLSDSMHASSESLASSSQLEFNPGEGANGRNMETIREREKGAFSTNYSSAAIAERRGHIAREWGENLYKEQRESGPGDAYSSNPVADSKPVPRDKVLPGVTVQKTKAEWSTEAERSAQLIRDEARLISRHAGGGSQWLGPDADEYLQTSKPETVTSRSVPMNPSPDPVIRQTIPVNPPPASRPSSYLFPQQPYQQQQQQPVIRRIIPGNPSPEPAIRRSVPLNPSPTSLPSNHPFPQQPQQQQHQQQQQQPWNRKLLQDISAPPKHRLQDSESWITARLNDDEFEEVRRPAPEVEQQVAPVAMRAPPSRPSVPVRTDSLKQTSQVPAAPLPQSTGTTFALASSTRQPAPTSSGHPSITTEVLTTNLWQAGYSDISSGSSQENLGATRWPTSSPSSVSPKPDSFEVPALSTKHFVDESYSIQSRAALMDQRPNHPTGGASDPLVFPRYSEVGPTPGTHPPEVRLSSYELPLRSASYNVPQPSRSRPYSCDLSQFSSPVLASPGAVPYQRSIRDPTLLEPASEAVSMLFDYHRSPSKEDVARLSLDISRSHGPKSQSESSKTLTPDGGQKCAGCDNELGFGRCIVLESLDFCFHPGCFKCSVCRCPLRNHQSLRDEFRILASKLHCRNCYTNEQEGLKYSKV